MPVYRVQPDQVATALLRGLRLRFYNALALLVVCLTVITSGFYLIDVVRQHRQDHRQALFDALWNTLNVVSTVGSLEDVSPAERAWATVAIIVGLGAVLYSFGVLQALLQGDVVRLIERRKMRKTLRNMSGHIIVCGYGRVGRAVAAAVKRQGRQAVVIDCDPAAAARADEDGYAVVEGDCDLETTLAAASIASADGLIAALDSDAANVSLILGAREAKPRLRIVSRAERRESRSKLTRAGADRVIVPSELAAQQLSHLLLKPIVSEFVAAATGEGEYDFAELQVADYPVLQGRTLQQLDLPRRAEAVVISIVTSEGAQKFNPRADTALEAGDTLLLVCREGGLERIAQLA